MQYYYCDYDSLMNEYAANAELIIDEAYEDATRNNALTCVNKSIIII